MRVIGITGSIACGKSTISRELVRRGWPVIDGDLLSRELTASGGSAMKDIRSVFGSSYILPDGSLNRKEMGNLVFTDPLARERLDRLMAPYLRSLTQERIEAARTSGASLCFLDFPLLYEKGYDRYCDTVWCVWIPEDLQLQRLMERDGFTREEALSRMRAVMSADEKADRSPVIIDNSDSVEDTLLQVDEQLETELSRVNAVPRRRRTGAPVSGAVPEDTAAAASVSVPAVSAPAAPASHEAFARPEGARKNKERRKSSWLLPAWLRIILISLAAVLTVSFTAQMLMNAYLTRQQEKHAAEQNAIDEHYPLLFGDEIAGISAEYNLSPALIAAVIMNESSFRPTVQSSVGARGLMQVMPDTAEWIAGKLRMDNYSTELLDEPAVNIRFGCWYLNYLSSLFNGDPLCVVCAYHAGQGEISSWLANPLYSSNGTTLNRDNLPEGPTKQYAGRVTRDYGIYKAKYFSQADPAAPGADAAVR